MILSIERIDALSTCCILFFQINVLNQQRLLLLKANVYMHFKHITAFAL
jgi:hypothetical protein